MSFGSSLNPSGTSTFSFGSTPTQNQPTFGTLGGGDAGAAKPGGVLNLLGTPKTTVPTTTTTSLNMPPGHSGWSIGSNTAATGTSSTTALTTAAAVAPSTTATNTPSAVLSTLTKTSDSTTASTALNFSQIEEHINKWTLELEEQQKNFTNQATTINAWDKLLILNNDKIMELNNAVKKVQADQKTLEQELEFISTQHSELEESIVPLQKELLGVQADVERTQTYLLVEKLDTQLRQMSEDLREVIDHLNEANKSQDNNDPITQIGKILNAHMSSLQWIESSTSVIGSKLEEISKMHDALKRNYEKSNLLSFYE